MYTIEEIKRAMRAAGADDREINEEIAILGESTIVDSINGDGSDLVSEGGWDENFYDDVIAQLQIMWRF